MMHIYLYIYMILNVWLHIDDQSNAIQCNQSNLQKANIDYIRQVFRVWSHTLKRFLSCNLTSIQWINLNQHHWISHQIWSNIIKLVISQSMKPYHNPIQSQGNHRKTHRKPPQLPTMAISSPKELVKVGHRNSRSEARKIRMFPWPRLVSMSPNFWWFSSNKKLGRTLSNTNIIDTSLKLFSFQNENVC